MKRIAVTGGKGGTGKSTFSVLYALKLAKEGKKVVLVDADVECPNCHLLLGKELKSGKGITLDYPKADKGKCVKCGMCAKACTRNAIFWASGKQPEFFDNLCDACGACFVACPQGAISAREVMVGEVFENRINKNILLVSGRSREGLAETSRVVSKTKTAADKAAERERADFIIVDSAAGMHCSVISALVGSEKIFGVTEPTPLGEYDLGLMLELIGIMGVPAEIVVNKSTVGDKKLIYRLAKKHKTKISFEIPYSREVIEAYSKGKLEGLEGLL